MRDSCFRCLAVKTLSSQMSGKTINSPLVPSLEEKPKQEKKKLKPCCACPETKKVRDACIVEHGEENCGKLIEAHKECMRKMGFNV
ncbi:Cytochrome c oxidase copper chaperone [Acropora cervicornis]|uniref:Cytochrome c oxidase copper chaperone n=1 Tax=Acropora cervicornis TaxID=6130 RepID=A0AAD9VFR0_ACRCE|nr:Cytochrome c oxidase copper chaperone [Acropora cervicornis]